MQEWVGRVAVALDLPAELAQRHADELLDMVGKVAHGPSRPGAQLTAFLVGLSAGAADDKDAAIERALAVVASLADSTDV